MCVFHLEEITAAPVLLDVVSTGALPEVIGEGEENRVGANLLDDGLDGLGLLSLSSNGLAVVATGVGPAGLEGVDILAGADLSKDIHLSLDELTALRGG